MLHILTYYFKSSVRSNNAGVTREFIIDSDAVDVGRKLSTHSGYCDVGT